MENEPEPSYHMLLGEYGGNLKLPVSSFRRHNSICQL